MSARGLPIPPVPIPPIRVIARWAAGLPGTVSPGTEPGAKATPSASTSSTPVAATRAGETRGDRRSAEISTATTAIHTRLIAPSANRTPINAHELARHRTPARIPATTPGPGWLIGAPSFRVRGPRHRASQRRLVAVSW